MGSRARSGCDLKLAVRAEIHPPLIAPLAACNGVADRPYTLIPEPSSPRACSQAIEAEVITPDRLRLFTTQALANSLWAYATLRFYPTNFLEASVVEVTPAQNEIY